MKISLRTRPFLCIRDPNPKKEDWEERGIADMMTAIQTIREFNWEEEVEKLQKAANSDKRLTTHQVAEPAFNLYNEEDGAELYVGCFEKDNFGLSLMIVGEQTRNDILGLSFQQVIPTVELFYQEAYEKIEEYRNLSQYREPQLKLNLEERDRKNAIEKVKSVVIWWIFRIGIVIAIYLILKSI